MVSTWVPKMNFKNGILHFEAKCRPSSLFPANLDPFMITDTTNKRNLDEEAYFNFLISDKSNFLMPIEVNPRLGGSEAWSMTYAAFDVNLIQEYLNACLGYELNQDELKRKQQHPRFQCISKDLHPGYNAKINSVQVRIQQLARDPNLVEAFIYRSPGETLTYLESLAYIAVICNPYDADVTASSEEALLEKRKNVLKYFDVCLSS